jgi:hypothetical protein
VECAAAGAAADATDRVMSKIRVMSKMRRFSLIALATTGILFFGLSRDAAVPDG